jgi:hypothetical protein
LSPNEKGPNEKGPGGFSEFTKIRVKYSVVTEDHDGYCSDPGDTTTRHSTIVVTYPLSNTFTSTDIVNSGGILTIPLDNPKLKFYNIDDKHHGNGYCGLSTTYEIKSNKILNYVI